MTAHTDPPNDPSPQDDDEHLPCGRLLSRVWDAWEQQADDPHLRSCPHCRQAVHGLDQLGSAVLGLREEEAADAPATDAAVLTRRVMDVVRLELRPGRPLPLGEPGEDLWITEAVAARALRAAAETVGGVRAGSCRIVGPLGGGPAGDRAAGAVEIVLDVHTPADAFLPHLADRVRDRVRDTADRELGMAVAAVDIRITDRVDPPGGGKEGRTP
ncbi:Asp23/Gls24 family envelope stress response protein [Streptomyces actuosus]|uniref:Asp23/Gls24 family envelope stress response protein n=1 Tax=Streptomyces actuosus TaxID=1885 RepID=A0ABS2VKA2_STRAS|nr:Asp23/Gls24 family envelope stress response protein [Streptomyces actuosus]MBN0043476.1 Asp23/Gls24 family envelope stress response protein [Streptomyces actuosus]